MQRDHYGRTNCTSFIDPDFAAMLESLGCKGYRVTRTENLPAILEEAFLLDVPAVIDCPVDCAENARLTL